MNLLTIRSGISMWFMAFELLNPSPILLPSLGRTNFQIRIGLITKLNWAVSRTEQKVIFFRLFDSSLLSMNARWIPLLKFQFGNLITHIFLAVLLNFIFFLNRLLFLSLFKITRYSAHLISHIVNQIILLHNRKINRKNPTVLMDLCTIYFRLVVRYELFIRMKTHYLILSGRY